MSERAYVMCFLLHSAIYEDQNVIFFICYYMGGTNNDLLEKNRGAFSLPRVGAAGFHADNVAHCSISIVFGNNCPNTD